MMYFFQKPIMNLERRFKRVINHPIRKQIINLLKDNNLSVSEIQDKIGRSQPYTSLQLRELKDEDVVESTVQGQKRIYKLNKKIWGKE